MKYLKLFELFSWQEHVNGDDIEKYCEDILIELNHEKFKTKVTYISNFDVTGRVFVYISRIEKFTKEDIQDVVDSLTSYLSSQKFELITYEGPKIPFNKQHRMSPSGDGTNGFYLAKLIFIKDK